MFLIGCGVLAGLWPFHTWSPDGHVAAPTAVSMLHAGVLMKLGAFGIIRLGIQLLPEGAQFWMPGLMVLATTNVIYGAISAMAQRDFKYMVGYSSVSHMGYVLMGLATLNPIGVNGAVLQMFSHGVMTALMFAMVGAVYDQAHVRDMSVFGGLANKMPRFTAFFAIAGLASLGLPGLSGFVAEFHIFVGDVPDLSGVRRPRHLRRGDNGGLHPAHAGDGVLRAVQRTLVEAGGDDALGAGGGRCAHLLPAVHGDAGRRPSLTASRTLC